MAIILNLTGTQVFGQGAGGFEYAEPAKRQIKSTIAIIRPPPSVIAPIREGYAATYLLQA